MPDSHRTPAGEAATRVILSTFRANGLLLGAGDLLGADEGLTSARWQVLGAISLADRPLTVPQIARRMGLTRQSVQRTADLLEMEGLVGYAGNPSHRRAKLVRLTPLGATVLDGISRRQVDWANRIARGMPTGEQAITDALEVLRQVRAQLEQPAEPTTSSSRKRGVREAR
jgi:DNA-binding MarR family transcriptional regulator